MWLMARPFTQFIEGNRDVGHRKGIGIWARSNVTTEMLSSVYSIADKISFRETGIYFQY